MSTVSARALTLRRILFAVLLLLICVLIVRWLNEQSKPWVIPLEYKSLKNPLLPSESLLSSARETYADQCVQCHGERGKGDGPQAWMHRPLPADLTDTKHITSLTDGEIFYQITEGRRPMPSFRHRLTEDQRWELVLLVRAFAQPTGRNGETNSVGSRQP